MKRLMACYKQEAKEPPSNLQQKASQWIKQHLGDGDVTIHVAGNDIFTYIDDETLRRLVTYRCKNAPNSRELVFKGFDCHGKPTWGLRYGLREESPA